MQNRMIPAETILNRLDALLQRNSYTEAKQHLLYWLSEAEKIEDGKGKLLLYNELMGLCRKLGEKEAAISYAEKALHQIQVMEIEQNVGAATTYLNCGTVFKAFNKAEQSIPYFEKAKTIYEKNLTPDDSRLAGLYNNMALALVDIRQFDTAITFYQNAITTLEMQQNTQPEQAITYLNMATAAEMQFGLEEGEKIISDHIQTAWILLESCKERTDGNYAFVCEKCATVFGYYGYFDYESKLTDRYRRIYEGS